MLRCRYKGRFQGSYMGELETPKGERETERNAPVSSSAASTPAPPSVSLKNRGSDPEAGRPSPLRPITGETASVWMGAGVGENGWLRSCWPGVTSLACLCRSACFFPVSWWFWL